MDYEKKYKEALENMRRFRDALNNHEETDLWALKKEIVTDIEYYFPELKESEDERIRNALIRFHKSTIDIDGIKGADILAWIEKQGSSSVKWQKNTPDNKPAINHSVLMKTTHGVAEGYFVGSLWFQFRWSSNIKDSDVLAWMELSDLDEQGEQKPTSDVRYEVSAGGSLIIVNGKPFDYEKATITQKDFAPKQELKKVEDEIEIPFGAKDSELQEETYYIPKGFHAEIDDDKVIIKKGEKSAAWSDEDELVVLSIEQVIQCASSLNLVPEKLDKIDKWLKSLKDRIGWKPSEEQMHAFIQVYVWYNNNFAPSAALTSLYNDLKKL